MGKLKAIGSHLQPLKPIIGYVQHDPPSRDAQRLIYSPWRKWYTTARWRQLRIRIFERDGYTCQRPECGRVEGNTSKLVADHREPHRGDEARFWDENGIWTLCKLCHDGWKQRLEQGGALDATMTNPTPRSKV